MRMLFVLSIVTWIGSMILSCYTLYPIVRQPDQFHTHREFSGRSMATRYLTDTQELLFRPSQYAFWASMVVMVASGLIRRRLEARSVGAP
jgi:hypothetical protein